MKIVFFGDSITDMSRDRNCSDRFQPYGYGEGYPMFIAGALYGDDPLGYEIINKGNGGDRIVDLYARVKSDVWNLNPDVLSILIGINDVWHKLLNDNGVELPRFEKIYRMLIEDTKKVLPNVKIILCEPFFLNGEATEDTSVYPDAGKTFLEVFDYAKTVRRLAEEYGLFFLPLQKAFDKKAEKFSPRAYLYDGVHPSPAGAKLIADEWIGFFKEKVVNK